MSDKIRKTDWTKGGKPSITHQREQSCCCCRYAWEVQDELTAEVARLREVVDCVRVLRVSPSVGGGGAEYNARRLLYDLLQALAQEDQT